MILENKRVLITGGTGSLGKVLVWRLLSGEMGHLARLVVFSRDEAKQNEMRMAYQSRRFATDDIIYRNFENTLEFYIGDVRDHHSIAGALNGVDVIFNAAALKQVPTCEYFPYEAVKTNILGPENIVRAIRESKLAVDTVVGISTDKACKPVNVMGMTKAIQERVFTSANVSCPHTRFICARYGNVLASRGSVIPLFLDQIRSGGPLTITASDMTRFLLTLDRAVDTIFKAVKEALPGQVFIPKVPSASVVDIADVLIGDRLIEKKLIGIRPGEKTHEILISEEECHRTLKRENYYVIEPILPQLRAGREEPRGIAKEYSSADKVMDKPTLKSFLETLNLDDYLKAPQEEFLR